MLLEVGGGVGGGGKEWPKYWSFVKVKNIKPNSMICLVFGDSHDPFMGITLRPLFHYGSCLTIFWWRFKQFYDFAILLYFILKIQKQKQNKTRILRETLVPGEYVHILSIFVPPPHPSQNYFIRRRSFVVLSLSGISDGVGTYCCTISIDSFAMGLNTPSLAVSLRWPFPFAASPYHTLEDLRVKTSRSRSSSISQWEDQCQSSHCSVAVRFVLGLYLQG